MRRALLGLAVFLAVAAGARSAGAYPHFQIWSDTWTCSQCHYAPAGGGLLTGWGRDESGDTLSRGGDGRFLHGLLPLPRALALGGDVRLAARATAVGSPDGVELAAFPMQLDVNARVAAGSWSVAGTFGLRGVARSGSPTQEDGVASEVEESSLASYLVSREHYLSWRPRPSGAYARAGRFFAPFGLRLADHTAYVRRYLGTNLLEETYGLSGGRVERAWEAHATAFISDPIRGAARDEVGAAAMGELRAGPASLGASARVGFGDADTRLAAGVFGKAWWAGARLFFLGELDAVRQGFEAGGDRWQLAAYAGPVWIPARGVYVGAAYELFDEDLAVAETERHALGGWVSVLPWAHVELMLSGRAQLVGTDDQAWNALAQLHYYL